MDGEKGVCFDRRDCAGHVRRLLILLIDGVVVSALAGLAPESAHTAALAAGAGLCFVVLERYSATPGYLLTGSRVVTLKGERPSFLRMAGRFALWVLGPVHPLIDFLWLGGDDQRQTIRDKFAGTLVVRRKAEPVGRGPILLKRYTPLGFSFAFFEVESGCAGL